mmetsp:Transcript_12737/g.17795  ORF Transcript_12737/g.17795 Transcript_12737/m.17795 type:complete len:112 (+) Transcript_12737:181-516(+)|eukprot:jgi/Bigna1/59878/fgenesh1_kg.7_\
MVLVRLLPLTNLQSVQQGTDDFAAAKQVHDECSQLGRPPEHHVEEQELQRKALNTHIPRSGGAWEEQEIEVQVLSLKLHSFVSDDAARTHETFPELFQIALAISRSSHCAG